MTYGYLLQFCLSIAVLTSPAAPPPELFRLVNRPIVSICLSCEILDHREIRYVLAKPEEFVSDVAMIKIRMKALSECPNLWASCLFPDRTIVNELLLFNRSYRQHIENCLCVYPDSRDLQETRREIDQLYYIWDRTRDAQCEYYYVHIRRFALGSLLKELGPEDFWKGNLPPHVPIWRFTPIR